ncbi:hypothetical protein A3860_05825 [Niastella vici]|uniref:3-keto-disaccharide hydrolase domain-containing protein n=1 Tax=Niastella vici TaxID=1703345 RepID=A0A1V9FS54_9BACT|nr:hypothetical protein [Niastella vici]OQP61229.1 hypothetical protein A3860_05825 [Niastella vici]
MPKTFSLIVILTCCTIATGAQTITWKKQEFVLKNVTASVVKLNGEEVLKVERDLKALPFDINNMAATVDEPTYVKLQHVELENGIIEVKLLSRIQDPSPFEGARGFIGLAFRISENDTAYESIYVRPKNGQSEDQLARNHTVQYYSYPHYKFDRLRREAAGVYETYADIGLNEWITFRVELAGDTAKLYINDQKHPAFIVNKMKGDVTKGAIALWVDIGTTGYFKDLTITKK